MVSEAKQTGAFVRRRLHWLAECNNESMVKSTLARLRRGVGKPPGSLPDLWEITLSGLPEVPFGRNQEPSRGEWTVHTALTLFALHQQGKDLGLQCMNKEGYSLGVSVRKLIETDRDRESAIIRRFHAVAMSEHFERVVWHLRGLIQLFRAQAIPLDYAALTEDLYWFQHPARRDSVRLKWGQDLYRNNEETDGEDNHQKGEMISE